MYLPVQQYVVQVLLGLYVQGIQKRAAAESGRYNTPSNCTSCPHVSLGDNQDTVVLLHPSFNNNNIKGRDHEEFLKEEEG